MEKLKLYRKQKGLNQIEAAEYLGITQSSYSKYESGQRQPDLDMLRKLSELYGVTIDDLTSPTTNPVERSVEIKTELISESEVMIPVIASLRCGFNAAGIPYDFTDKKPVPKSYILRWGKTIVFNEAVGNSMLPTIRPRDLMVCVPGDIWEDGDIVIIDVNDTDTVKRIYRANDGGIDLVPDNEKYKEVHYTPEELEELQIHVLGRVVKIIGPDLYPKPRRKK